MLLLLLAAAAASGDALRDFCPDRPGLNTPPCTMDRGHADVEVGLADWTLDRHGGERNDSFILGDTLVRYGLTESLELQAEWQGLGFERDHEADGSIRHDSGSGDIRLALRQSLHNPDGSGFSLAMMPFVTLPVGNHGFGDPGWTAGLILPVSYDLPHGLQLAFTAEADAAADEEGPGHHFAWSATAGLGVPINKAVDATLELQRQRDEDPAGSTNSTLGALSLAWQPGSSMQFDIGSVVGLSRNAPDVELYAGLARRF